MHTRPGTTPKGGLEAHPPEGVFLWANTLTYGKRGLKTAYNKPSTCGFAKSWGTFCGIKISTFIRRQRRTFGVMGDACARSMYLPL